MRIPFTHCLFLSIIFLAPSAFGQSPNRTEAKLISMPEYALSPEAAAAGIDGQLIVSMSIDTDGTVKSATIVGGPSWPCGANPKTELAEVREGVRQEALQAKFSPPTKEGRSQAADLFVTVLIGKKLEEYKRRLASGPQTLEQGPRRIIKAGVINGKALRLAKPAYPPEARANRVAGMVEVDVIIDEQGRVAQAGALRGSPFLQPAAREAACQSTFSPTVLEGHPVQVMGIITYGFLP